MPTYQSTLPDGRILKTEALTKAKARANLAHRLSFTLGHRKAYAMLGPVKEARPEPFTPRSVTVASHRMPKQVTPPQVSYRQTVLGI